MQFERQTLFILHGRLQIGVALKAFTRMYFSGKLIAGNTQFGGKSSAWRYIRPGPGLLQHREMSSREISFLASLVEGKYLSKEQAGKIMANEKIGSGSSLHCQ